MNRVFGVMLAVAGAVAAQSGVPDLLFHGGRDMGDIRGMALGNAGCALPEGALSVWRNPALPHSFCKDTQYKGLLTGASYSQAGPLYDGSIVTAGGGYYMGPKGTVINMYRYLMGSEDQQTDYQSMVTYAGQMFQKGDRQGAVDYGINVRYEQANWTTHGFPDLKLYRKGPFDTVRVPYDTSRVLTGSQLEKRLLLDVGFFQANVLNNLDFALVLRNLAGYVWRDSRPWVESISGLDSTSGTQVDTLSGARYDDTYRNTDGWVDGWYRSVTVGASFRSALANDKVVLRIPFEFEVLGLLDKADNHTMFRCGVEAEIAQHVALRFGFAREPDVVLRGAKIENENVFTGGAGVRIRGVTVDGAFGADMWGAGATFTY